MNVLILTPDRVGSTLLQRLVTIYMLRRGFDRPVINLHELSNGLRKYYNNTLNQEVLGKSEGPAPQWGYFQTLSEVQDLLKSVDHYKTSRLAHYHIVNRQDSVAEQIKFYEYLNDNFFIISCRRRNLLEHALSWGINGHSKKLNVYSTVEKINVFQDIYANGITIHEQTLINYLNKYKSYIEWTDTYFNVQSYFDYDTDIHRIEDYILNLDFMRGHSNNTWADMFGQDWDSYNACHRLLPNLVLDSNESGTPVRIATETLTDRKWQQLQGPDWPRDWRDFETSQLPQTIRQEIDDIFKTKTVLVNQVQHAFLTQNLKPYLDTTGQLAQLCDDGFLVSPVPIKLQSMAEKQKIIHNWDQTVEWYNNWAKENNEAQYSSTDLNNHAQQEETQLNQRLTQQLAHTERKFLSSH
jgi:hypothetical protein